MGIDKQYIRLVVQWLLPRGVWPLSRIRQRAGCAAQAPSVHGNLVCFIYKDLIGPLPQEPAALAAKGERAKVERRANVPREDVGVYPYQSTSEYRVHATRQVSRCA